MLLITGMKSKYVGDTEAIHREMKPGLCSIIKAKRILIKNWNEPILPQVEDVSEPLAESMEKVAEAVLLFCQVLKPHRHRLDDAGMILFRVWGCCPLFREEYPGRTAEEIQPETRTGASDWPPVFISY